MNKVLLFYNYEQCYRHYTNRILNIRQAKIYGEVIVAKPVLLLTIIDEIDNQNITCNRIVVNERLEENYLELMSKYARNSQFDELTGIEKPFWHLETDEFWHLQYPGERLRKTRTPSKAWLRDNIEFAYFDEDLWILLQNKVWRQKLRDYIVEHKLSDGHRQGKLAAEGLGAIAAILLVA